MQSKISKLEVLQQIHSEIIEIWEDPDLDELKELFTVTSGISALNIDFSGSGRVILFRAVLDAGRNGWLSALIKRAGRDDLNRADRLNGLFKAFGQAPGEITDVHLAGHGFSAIPSLVGNPLYGCAIKRFKEEYGPTHEQLRVLGAYKDLHDLLHVVQFRCYNLLSPESRKNNDLVDWARVEEAEMTLREETDKGNVIALKPFIPNDHVRWLTDFHGANALLQVAIDNEDLSSLKKAERSIGRVIAVRLPDMNVRLNEKAKALQLSPVLETLSGLPASDSEEGEALSDSVIQLYAGLDAIKRLNQKLEEIVKLHNDWQSIDMELRPLEAILRFDSDDLNYSWDSIHTTVSGLCKDFDDEDWVKRLKKAAEKLTLALHKELTSKQSSFKRYYREVASRFYLVDHELKELCEDMCYVSGEISSVLSDLS